MPLFCSSGFVDILKRKKGVMCLLLLTLSCIQLWNALPLGCPFIRNSPSKVVYKKKNRSEHTQHQLELVQCISSFITTIWIVKFYYNEWYKREKQLWIIIFLYNKLKNTTKIYRRDLFFKENHFRKQLIGENQK